MLTVKKRINGFVERRFSKEIAIRIAGLLLAWVASQGWLPEGMTTDAMEEHQEALGILLYLTAESIAQMLQRRRQGEEVAAPKIVVVREDGEEDHFLPPRDPHLPNWPDPPPRKHAP